MPEPHILILNFHGLGPPPPGIEDAEVQFWVSVDFFTRVLDRVRELPGVRITFDDGNASDFEVALPELARRGQQAEFFLLAERLDKPGYLTEAQVRTMATEGMTIGSHGMAHRRWPDCDDAILAEEIRGARARVEDVIGRPIASASCPFGAYDRRSLTALREAGFTRVYSSDRGLARPGDWLQCRNTLRVTDTISDVEGWLRWSPHSLRSYKDRLRIWLKASMPRNSRANS